MMLLKESKKIAEIVEISQVSKIEIFANTLLAIKDK